MAKEYKIQSIAGVDCFNGTDVDLKDVLDTESAGGWKLVHVTPYPALNFILFIWDKDIP